MKRMKFIMLLICVAFTSCLKILEGETLECSGPYIKTCHLGMGVNATLNTYSCMRYKSPSTDAMAFNGEGAFMIAQESAEGVTLQLAIDGIKLTCADGEFYVNAYGAYGWNLGKPAEVRLAVFKGKVRVQNAGVDTTIADGAVAIFNDSVSTAINWQPKELTYWVNQLYKVEQVPIYEFKAMLNRWFDVKAGVLSQNADSMLYNVRIQRDLPLAPQLKALEENNDYLFTVFSADSITIRHK
ncbi:hypothetical protein [Chitinophaga filiformis]|uniref:FecR protein n=1 Tax=Chitinophaga filiformis TaxID=104663 RepID=A0A1G7MIB4_CHIFI|nr:hypothetical protein [Chitinophaga filiformis]SDF61356.1 hypothetical protein SAMN04488121_102440 [Chitinophaga filiformis]